MAFLNKAIKKMFMTGSYFTIAVRKKESANILGDEAFHSCCTLPADSGEWCADPMLVENDGRTFLFYEAVTGTLGRIEVRELLADCTVSSPTIVLCGDGHYSYPFVFCNNGEWFMIPETSDREKVSLYRSVEFPYKWEEAETLLVGRFVDTTVFHCKGSWVLLTFETSLQTECVIPKAFRVCFGSNGAQLEPLKWMEYDPLRVRGAGPVFSIGEALIRPVQISTEHRYGDAVAFHKVSIDGLRYSETECGMLTPDRIRCGKVHADGLHTYSTNSRFEAIDVRCRDFDLLKPIKKTARILFKDLKVR